MLSIMFVVIYVIHVELVSESFIFSSVLITSRFLATTLLRAQAVASRAEVDAKRFENTDDEI